MKYFNYGNHMIVKCPTCGKKVINDNLEEGEVNGVHACKHLLFVYIANETVDTHFYYVKSGIVKSPDSTILTDQDFKTLDSDPKRIVHVYTSFGDKWIFLFQQVAPKAGDMRKICYDDPKTKATCPICGKNIGTIGDKKIKPCKHLMFHYGGYIAASYIDGQRRTYFQQQTEFKRAFIRSYSRKNYYFYNLDKVWRTQLFDTVMKKKKCIGIKYASQGLNRRWMDFYAFTLK